MRQIDYRFWAGLRIKRSEKSRGVQNVVRLSATTVCLASSQGRLGILLHRILGQVTTLRSQTGGSAMNAKRMDIDFDEELSTDIAPPYFAMGWK